MKYRHVGNSGLEVSEIGLGANSFGEPGRRDASESAFIIHAAIDLGINFIDTSNVYAQGKSEEYIGQSLAGRRDEMLVATKFGSRRVHGPNNFGGSRKFVMNAIEASLHRLQTDYIDLYMIHRPDTRMPLAETLRAMDDLVRQGKVRYVGCANFEAWRMVDGLWVSREMGLEKFISSQFAYSMLNRSAEPEMMAASRAHGIGVIPYLPLAAGLLSGKVTATQSPVAGTRMAIETGTADRWITSDNLAMVAKLDDWARERDHTVLERAFAWLLADPAVATVIAGASSPEQIAQNAAAADWELTPSERTEVTGILDSAPSGTPDDYYSVAAYFKEQTEVSPAMSR